MRQVRRLAYRTGHALRRPPPPRWRAPALYTLLATATAGLLAASLVIADRTGLTDRARFAAMDRLVALTDGMGMRIADVLTEGRQRTSAGEIYRILEPYYGQNALSVDIAAIQQRLQSLPWVRDATVTRLLPDRLSAQLVEHRPIALWMPQVGPRVAGQPPAGPALVSDRGDIIQVSELSPYRHLPILSGADAPAAAPDLLRLLQAEPELAERVTGAERVDGRRWNVFVDGRIEVRLPEREPALAWTRLARLDRDDRLLARAIEAVDLRLEDRVVVRLADEILHPEGGSRPTAALPQGQRT
jgi:cell division protein FtsQ